MHESDGHIAVIIARKLQCRASHCGHVYIQWAGTNYICPKCGFKEYDIFDEYYPDEEMKGDADAKDFS